MTARFRRLLLRGLSVSALLFAAAGLLLAGLVAGSGRPVPALAAPAAESDGAGVAPERLGPQLPAALAQAKAGELTSYVRPDDALVYSLARERVGPGAAPAAVEAAAEAVRLAWAAEHYHGPDPLAQDLALRREQAILDGADTDAELAAAGAPAVEGTLRLLAIAVEFDGSDTVESFSHEDGIRSGRCITETVTYTGPRHNEIKAPGPLDNNTFWMPAFEKDFFEKIILSETGITERVRLDLVDPSDGQPGINLAGLTMANYFREVSSGRLSFDAGPAGIQAWVKVPHSVGYYAANSCRNGRVSGSGLTTNPRFPAGMSQLIADIATAINAANPDFPWADYDTDGNGIVDHVQLFHAGIDESEGGGIHGQQQIWAHRGNADGQRGGVVVDDRGTPDAADDVRIRGYTIQPENLNLGVLVHEFGHDLGLPDLYTSTGSENAIWWDLMSTGSHTGRLKGSDPTHMSTWTKLSLGWGEPELVTPIDDPRDLVLGQVSQPPAGSKRGLRVDLPPSRVRMITLPAGSSQAWWSGRDQARAGHRLVRDVDLRSVSGPISLTYQLDYVLERDWDYLFLEVSTDAGLTWQQLKGYRLDNGQELTTPDDYADPNGALASYGNRKHGFTGNSQSWRNVRHDLSAFAGQALRLQFHYATDAGGQERGVFVDNLAIRAGATTIFADPVENGDRNGWTSEPGSFNGAPITDAGWRLSDGIQLVDRYYLLEWRNTVAFDTGLKYTYNTVFARVTADGAREFRTDKVPSNVPGLLVWLRDLRFGGSSPANGILTPSYLSAVDSEGAKGGLLLVDAHPDPLRGPLGGSFQNAFGRYPFPPNDNWSGRVQTANSAFSLADTAALTLTVASGTEPDATPVLTATGYAGLPAVPAFHDALGYLPGVEELPLPITVLSDTTRQRIKRYAFVDPDAGVVVPAAGYYPPKTPAGFTGLGAETSPPSADIGTDETMYLRGETPTYVDIGGAAEEAVTGAQTGNPGDRRLHYGFHFEILRQAQDGSTGTVRLWRQADAAEVTASWVTMWLSQASSASATVPGVEHAVQLRNVGGAGGQLLYSDFDESVAGLVADSVRGGGVPVAVGADEALRAVRAGGSAALAALAVPADQAKAIVWTGTLPSGGSTQLGYNLAPRALGVVLSVTSGAYAVETEAGLLDQVVSRLAVGSRVLLPVVWRGE